MKITYYGHSCFAAEINGKNLLFDPFITQNSLAKAIDIKKIKADNVMGVHYDTFPAIKIDHDFAKEKFRSKGDLTPASDWRRGGVLSARRTA